MNPDILTAQIAHLSAQNAKLRQALAEIRDHWANQYNHPKMQSPNYSGMYGIGVVDGHRAAAAIARTALEDDQ
jgi:hypothetical protein